MGFQSTRSHFLFRLARLTVVPSTTKILGVRTTNVKRFSSLRIDGSYTILRIDGDEISLNLTIPKSALRFERDSSSQQWTVRKFVPFQPHLIFRRC